MQSLFECIFTNFKEKLLPLNDYFQEITMKRFLSILLLVSLFCGTEASAKRRNTQQLPEEMLSPTKTFAESLRDDYTHFYNSGGVFEKLYLMTDRPYYSAGETLYFSGYLVHATMLTRNSASNFIYVELISPEGRLVERVKIAATNKQFIGTFMLSARLTSGRYKLRAYTRWMMNFDMGYFFTKDVYIGNAIDDAITTSISYSEGEKGQFIANIRFVDQNGLPIVSTPVRYRSIIDGRSRGGSQRTDKSGAIKVKFTPSDSAHDGFELHIRANSRDLSRYVQMPSFTNNFDVQFCPEGGNLIANLVQVVAFKAQSANGRSVEVEGAIYNEAGEEISKFKSEHLGMGRFAMCAEPGVKYYAEVTSADGLTRRFDLPVAQPSGVALRVMRQNNGYTILAQATPDQNLADYACVVHSRGAVMTVVESLVQPLRLRNEDMFDGIAQVSVVHRPTRKIVAERLFYVRDNRYATADIMVGEVFEQRQLVRATIAVKGSDGKPAKGNFSMSVTDATMVPLDEKAPNILSYMLLSSDLKGEVENPGYYFEEDTPRRANQLDLVMMTNGWRRYDLEHVMTRKLPRIIHPMEETQTISGSVYGLLGRARKPSIVVMNTKTKQFDHFELNEYNDFIVTGLPHNEDVVYLVQALNKRGKDTTVSIKIESDNYPVIDIVSDRPYYKNYVEPISRKFLETAREKYFYEGGERIVDIEEIVVVGRKLSTPFFASGSRGSTAHGDLSRYGSVAEILMTFKELDVLGNVITTRREYLDIQRDASSVVDITENPTDEHDTVSSSGGVDFSGDADTDTADFRTPEFILNGNVAHIDDIWSYDPKYIERISFIDGRAAQMLGISAPAGAIIMQVSQEGLRATISSDAIARVTVRGCQKPIEFYKPKYPTFDSRLTDVRDMRYTIAWEPLIRPDSLGMAAVSFYTADRETSYDIIIEGITDDGEICRNRHSIRVKPKNLIGIRR